MTDQELRFEDYIQERNASLHHMKEILTPGNFGKAHKQLLREAFRIALKFMTQFHKIGNKKQFPKRVTLYKNDSRDHHMVKFSDFLNCRQGLENNIFLIEALKYLINPLNERISDNICELLSEKKTIEARRLICDALVSLIPQGAVLAALNYDENDKGVDPQIQMIKPNAVLNLAKNFGKLTVSESKNHPCKIQKIRPKIGIRISKQRSKLS